MRSDTHITRRGALAGAAGAALATSMGAERATAGGRRSSRSLQRADVAVVGAGLSGLAAADKLRRAGRSVIVLEAQNRVGGRTLTTRLDEGYYVESGGVFIVSAKHERDLMEICRRSGIDQVDTKPRGQHTYIRDGQRVRYDPNGPAGRVPTPPGALADLARFNGEFERMIATLPPGRAWAAERAWEWDGMTFASFGEQQKLSPNGRWVIDMVTAALTGNEPRDMSLLGMMMLVRGAEGMSVAELSNEVGYHRFKGGAQSVSEHMAEPLGRHVVLSSPVRRIDQDGSGVRVVSDRLTVAAKHVVVAVPPFLTARILYDPILPAQRAQLTQRVPNASTFRVNVVYDSPFWYEDGLSGECWTDVDPFRFCLDVSPPDRGLGILTAFINGDAARRWSRASAGSRRASMLGVLGQALGPRAAKPKHYFEKGWAFEEWTASCQYGVFPPGVLTDFGEALRPSFGRVHWAGTEVAETWTGSMEGAIRAGYAAARAALE